MRHGVLKRIMIDFLPFVARRTVAVVLVFLICGPLHAGNSEQSEKKYYPKVKAILLQPNHIDFPVRGEQILLKISKQTQCYPCSCVNNEFIWATVTDVNKKKMFLLSDKQILWSVKNEQAYVDRKLNLFDAINSGTMTVISHVGVGPSIASGGIAGGIAGFLGGISGFIKDKEISRSFNISQGDSFVLKRERIRS